MSKLEDFCKKEVFVLDTETTGLTGAPIDKVVDIAICKVDLDDGIVTEVYSSVVGHDVSLWNDTLRNAWIFENTDMTLEMVSEAPSVETVIKEVTEILRGSNVTSFNRAFDFDKFLFKEPWSLRGKFIPVRCIMLASVNVCKLPGEFEEYKWPKLGEAYDIIVEDDPAGLNGTQSHRALSDALAASYVLLELYKAGKY